MIKKHPVVGVGLVHPNYAPDIFNFWTLNKPKRASILQTNDSGIITWLVTFGGIGIAWVLWMLGYLFLTTKGVIGKEKKETGVIVGIASYIWCVWLTSLTTTGFTFSRGVIVFSVLLYLYSGFVKET